MFLESFITHDTEHMVLCGTNKIKILIHSLHIVQNTNKMNCTFKAF